METRPSEAAHRATGRWYFVSRGFPIYAALVVLLAAAGCASPGEPVERRAPTPAAISDLAAVQSGNDVVLTCTIPKETVEHIALAGSPSVNIYRSLHTAAGAGASGAAAAPPAAPTLLVTIPPAMVTNYTANDHFRYVDALTAGDFLPNQQQTVATYIVRTSAAPNKESADSNHVDLAIYPAPQPITDLETHATQSGIGLRWTAPQANLMGDAPAITGYHVYRANAQTAQTAAAANASNSANTSSATSANPYGVAAGPSSEAPAPTPAMTSPLLEIGEAAAPEYRDGDAQKDKTYVYSVRSTIDAGGKVLESGDSNLASLTLHDTFPPTAPTQLIATPVPAENQMGPHIDISWAINPETDLAGYNVYRSEEAGAAGTKINPQLLPTPAFRDMNAQPGRSYYYTATAVDRTGNESAASAAVEANIPSAGAAGSQASP